MKTINNYEKCKLHSVEYKCRSTAGNPAYWVFFRDSAGEFQRGYTERDSSAGYTIQNYRKRASGAVVYLRYHWNEKGACVITDIQRDSPTAGEATKN